jgi:hypothetical protein
VEQKTGSGARDKTAYQVANFYERARQARTVTQVNTCHSSYIVFYRVGTDSTGRVLVNEIRLKKKTSTSLPVWVCRSKLHTAVANFCEPQEKRYSSEVVPESLDCTKSSLSKLRVRWKYGGWPLRAARKGRSSHSVPVKPNRYGSKLHSKIFLAASKMSSHYK